MATRRRGFRGLVEQPDSGELDFTGEAIALTRRFEGLYADCVAARPARGSAMADADEFDVDRSTIKRLPGGRGLLTITGLADPETESVSERPKEKFEVTWQRLEKPLIQHPMFFYSGSWGGDFPNPFPNRPDGDNGLTPGDIAEINNWEKCPDADIKAQGKFYTDNAKRLPAGGSDLSANAKVYTAKRMMGIENFAVFYPVCTLTSLQHTEPNQDPCGQIWTSEQVGDLGFDQMPQNDSGEDFVYMQIEDRRTRTGRSGKWERVRQWMGADYFDEDLYEAHT